jgi:hypothetical protein
LYGFYGYPMNDVVFDGFNVIGNKTPLLARADANFGIYFSDYLAQKVTINHADIENMRYGMIDPYFGGSTTTIENSFLWNSTDIQVRTLGANGADPNGAHRQPKSLIVRDVLFGASWHQIGVTNYNIDMHFTDNNGSSNYIQSDTVYVYDYNQIAGDNFQVYYTQQQADFIVPQTNGWLIGSPDAGLTNAQNWAKYHIAIAGAVAPSTATTDKDINGLIQPF